MVTHKYAVPMEDATDGRLNEAIKGFTWLLGCKPISEVIREPADLLCVAFELISEALDTIEG